MAHWLTQVDLFNGLELSPCHEIGNYTEVCDPAEAQFWTVYGHYKPTDDNGGVLALEDFPTEADGRAFAEFLLLKFPHLKEFGIQ